MATGVMGGYIYKLKVHHTHFPIQVEIKGKEVIVKNFLGERSIRRGNILGATKVELVKDVITVTGISKEDVGQTAANIEGACRLAGKDRRVFLDGIYITGWEKIND
jgi:large subunit ribosomal protein L6